MDKINHRFHIGDYAEIISLHHSPHTKINIGDKGKIVRASYNLKYPIYACTNGCAYPDIYIIVTENGIRATVGECQLKFITTNG